MVNAINTARLKATGEDWEFDMDVDIKEEIINHVKDIYRPFTAEQISLKISELL